MQTLGCVPKYPSVKKTTRQGCSWSRSLLICSRDIHGTVDKMIDEFPDLESGRELVPLVKQIFKTTPIMSSERGDLQLHGTVLDLGLDRSCYFLAKRRVFFIAGGPVVKASELSALEQSHGTIVGYGFEDERSCFSPLVALGAGVSTAFQVSRIPDSGWPSIAIAFAIGAVATFLVLSECENGVRPSNKKMLDNLARRTLEHIEEHQSII